MGLFLNLFMLDAMTRDRRRKKTVKKKKNGKTTTTTTYENDEGIFGWW